MATPMKRAVGDNNASPYLTRQPSRWRRNLVLLGLMLGVAALAWNWKRLHEQALVSAAYSARTGCVCRFVSQRSLKSCGGDVRMAGLGRMARFVWLSEDAANHAVKASVPLFASQSATFDNKAGCQLEPWTS